MDNDKVDSHFSSLVVGLVRINGMHTVHYFCSCRKHASFNVTRVGRVLPTKMLTDVVNVLCCFFNYENVTDVVNVAILMLYTNLMCTCSIVFQTRKVVC